VPVRVRPRAPFDWTMNRMGALFDSKMVFPAHKWGGLHISLALFLLWSSEAHAQRIPLILVGIAGTSLLAPFVAVPVKLVILRFLTAETAALRLWFISAMEWLLWFPVTVIIVLSTDSFAVPLVVPLMLASVAWLHRKCVDNASWGSALLLSLPTPILAAAIPSQPLISLWKTIFQLGFFSSMGAATLATVGLNVYVRLWPKQTFAVTCRLGNG